MPARAVLLLQREGALAARTARHAMAACMGSRACLSLPLPQDTLVEAGQPWPYVMFILSGVVSIDRRAAQHSAASA